MITILDRHATPTASALQQPGKKSPRRTAASRHFVRSGTLALLGAFKDVSFNNRKVGRIGGEPFLGWIYPGHTFSGVRVFHHSDPVPHNPSRIDGIDQYSVAPCCIPVERRARPDGPAGREHTIIVELRGDRAGVVACEILGKDAAHDLCLVGVNGQFTRHAGDWPVAVGSTTCVASVARDPSHTPPDLVREVLQIEGANQTADADLDLIGLAVVHRADFHACEAQPLVDPRKIFLIARDAVQCLDHQHGKRAGACGIHHSEQAVAAHDGCAGPGAVIIGSNDVKVFPAGIVAAKCDLVINRSVALKVG